MFIDDIAIATDLKEDGITGTYLHLVFIFDQDDCLFYFKIIYKKGTYLVLCTQVGTYNLLK